ncbi:MAG: ATP-binding protein [Candidatus Heimdallarchaeota archaeon]|nr:ATP-binding protein [Candidatus Heimdallarchaeota archaeon]
MLIEFSIENYRSIKDKVTFSMIASKDLSLEDNLITSILKSDYLLRSAVIYGANASGKSNILMAFYFLKALVLNSHNHQKGQGIKYEPFKLDQTCLQIPTRFQIIFIQNGIKYSYTIAFNGIKVLEESLYWFKNNRRALLFERINTEFRFTKDKTVQNFIAERTLENTLYLSKATQENYQEVFPVFDWFKNQLQFIGSYQPIGSERSTIDFMIKEPGNKELILKALAEADLALEDIEVNLRLLEKLPESLPPEIRSFINIAKNLSLEEINIKTSHKGVVFDYFAEESEGTKRLFSLIGPCLDALENGRVIIIDELDVKLHHKLNLFLVNLFHNQTKSKAHAQLIFTTHNTNLLDQTIFRRDQIWFTEKNEEKGSTELYSLVEFSPRKDKDIERGYLAGRYGALPFIKENGFG